MIFEIISYIHITKKSTQSNQWEYRICEKAFEHNWYGLVPRSRNIDSLDHNLFIFEIFAFFKKNSPLLESFLCIGLCLSLYEFQRLDEITARVGNHYSSSLDESLTIVREYIDEFEILSL